jgi:hypothetical protein
MIRQRPKHLAHAEPITGRAAKARIPVLDGNHQRCAGVMDPGIFGILAKARQNPDARVCDNDLETARGCGIGNKARLRHSTVEKHILPEFAHRANDAGRERLRKAGGDRSLFGPARPKGPMIGAVALERQPTKGKGAGSCAKFCPGSPALSYRAFERGRERRIDRDVCEQLRRRSTRHQNLDQRSDQAGAADPHRTHPRQLARLRRPQQVIRAGKITYQLMSLLLPITHAVSPRLNNQGVSDRHPSDIACRDRPFASFIADERHRRDGCRSHRQCYPAPVGETVTTDRSFSSHNLPTDCACNDI